MNLKLANKIQRNLPKLIRFGVVGSFGAGINFMIYFFSVSIFNVDVNIAAILAFAVSVINNYILNHCWTFATENNNNPINLRQLCYYILGNLQGLAINLMVLNMVIYFMGKDFQFIGQGLGILCGMLSNFLVAKKIVFRKKRENK